MLKILNAYMLELMAEMKQLSLKRWSRLMSLREPCMQLSSR